MRWASDFEKHFDEHIANRSKRQAISRSRGT